MSIHRSKPGDQKDNEKPEQAKWPEANTGNASNPTPQTDNKDNNQQLLGKEAETYLAEGGNIEDMPDPQQEKEAGE